MTRDEFVNGANRDDFLGHRPGRRLFVVAIDSAHDTVERSLRSALHDYFGSLCAGVRRIEPLPSCDKVVGEAARR